MKFSLYIFFVTILLFACSKKNTVDDRAFAKVETMNGVYIFIKSKPAAPYDFLGSIELKWYEKLSKLSDQNLTSAIKNITGIISFSDNLENTLSEIKQKYPSADGVIFDDEMNRCEVVKFK